MTDGVGSRKRTWSSMGDEISPGRVFGADEDAEEDEDLTVFVFG